MNTAFEYHGNVSLDSVIATAELARRQTRPADYLAENSALIALAEEMVTSPNRVLQKLAETAMSLCNAGSAGISLLESDGLHFYWPVVTGALASLVGGGTPREHGPCGTVLDRDAPLLMSHPDRHFTYLAVVEPAIEEVLLIPFYIDGKARGTIWVVGHDSDRRFQAEDLRLMTNLSIFAAAAYQMLIRAAQVEMTQTELRHSLGANKSLLTEIEERTQEEAILTDFSARIMQAQDEERRRIACELHDSTGQVLAAINMNLSQIRHRSSPEDAAKFTECVDLIDTAASEIRNLSYLLHPPMMDEMGLGSSIAEYAKGFESRSGLKIAVEVSNDVGRLAGNREIALFRIVQGSLANVRTHSGSPSATIRLFRDNQNVVLEIIDQGHGMKGKIAGKFKSGVGLRSMQERLRPLGGTLAIESTPSGTKVKVALTAPAVPMAKAMSN